MNVRLRLFISIICIGLSMCFLLGMDGRSGTGCGSPECIPCADIKDISFKGVVPDMDVTINSSAVIAASDQLPEYCQVKGSVGSNQFELRLPAKIWNNKLLHAGGAIYCGAINDLAPDALAKGYATTQTDAGHIGTGLPPMGPLIDPTPFYNNLDVKTDWGYRGVHVVTVAAKHLILKYYGRPERHSYFRGCSTGGRQALIAAQKYPDDFDGIIGGDGNIFFTGVTLSNIWFEYTNPPVSENRVLTRAKIPYLRKAVYDACDCLDGLTDGIIDDPRRCKWDIVSKQITKNCQADPNACFTSEELNIVRKFYDAPRNSIGEPLYPGGSPFGGEDFWTSLIAANVSSIAGMSAMGQRNLQYLLFPVDPGPTYNLTNFTWSTKEITDIGFHAQIYNATNYRLDGFKRRGGKIIYYHGWADYGMMPEATIYYYEKVREHMGHHIDNWFRLFMVPGMGHCSGGPGPNSFDMLTALENWVEKGIAPKKIIATGGTVPTRTRPLCPYPKVARWTGEGDSDKAENFICVDPDYNIESRDWEDIDHFSWDYNYDKCPICPKEK